MEEANGMNMDQLIAKIANITLELQSSEGELERRRKAYIDKGEERMELNKQLHRLVDHMINQAIADLKTVKAQ